MPLPDLRLVVVAAALALAAACDYAPDEMSEKDTRTVCINLGASGWDMAVRLADKAGAGDPAQAVRRAVREVCPAYAHRVPK